MAAEELSGGGKPSRSTPGLTSQECTSWLTNVEPSMARYDLLLTLVRAGASGDLPLFRKTVEALVAEERGKKHDILADRLVQLLQTASNGPRLTNGLFDGSLNGLAKSSDLWAE